MAVIPAYRQEPHDAHVPPSRFMLDTASAFWTVVLAAVPAVVLIWVLYAAWAAAPVISVDPNAEPWSKCSRSRRQHQCPRRGPHRLHRCGADIRRASLAPTRKVPEALRRMLVALLLNFANVLM